MSNLLFLDESNGNGFYATSKSNSPAKLSASPTIANINSKNAAATSAAATAANLPKASTKIDNLMASNAAAAAGVVAATLTTSVSNEDLSLSEYTDADESISAPTEFLAEFLSAVMLKDYKKALKYCKLILQYEPNNATAKEFYPLILEKLRATAASSDSDENYNKSSSPELPLEVHSVYLTAGDSDEATSDEQQQAKQPQLDNAGDDDSDDGIGQDERYPGGIQISDSSGFSGGDIGSGGESLGSVSMEEEEDDDDDDGEDIDEDDDVDDDDDEDALSSCGDDLPIHGEHVRLNNAGACLDNTSHSSPNSSSGTEGGRSRSDNTTHSYSSLLLEEDDDMLPTNLPFVRDKEAHELDVSNGNNVTSASCSDSESPTEPLTQRLAAILLSKCGVSSNGDNY